MIDGVKVFLPHELAFYESSVSRKANKSQANTNQQFYEITKKMTTLWIETANRETENQIDESRPEIKYWAFITQGKAQMPQ